MTSNQRRPGFRLPWSSEEEAAGAASQGERAENGSSPTESTNTAGPADAAPETAAAENAPAATVAEGGAAGASEFEAPAAGTTVAQAAAPAEESAQPDAPPAGETSAPAAPTAVAEPGVAPGETPAGFMRDLVAAMRGVAEETRQASLAELRTKSEERVSALQAETESRSAELRTRADADIAGVGEWERTEQERIKQEAEQKVVARRAQLDQQLAAEATRAESAAAALRERVSSYERELDAYHAQLSDIADPAAFAAAAKQMPSPPDLGSPIAVPTPVEPNPEPAASGEADTGTDEPATEASAETAAEVTTEPAQPDATTPVADAQPEPEAVTEPATEAVAAPGPQVRRGETAATEVLVKGLGSFGAITGFRQALAGVDGIDGVSLSLGPTGEFVFRAIHSAGFDVAAAITSLEGDAAKIEERPEGGIRVTLERPR
jgi:nicotinate-nucleotide--dimethylbenzimidazole phosphoribosyltransferase